MSRALWLKCDGEWFTTIPPEDGPFSPPKIALPDWGNVPPAGPPRAVVGRAESQPPVSRPPVPGPESREFPRRPAVQRVGYTIGDRFYLDNMRDISVGGMFIETPLALQIGQEVTVSIPFSDGRPPVQVRGEVVRIARDGIGIRFRRNRKTLRG